MSVIKERKTDIDLEALAADDHFIYGPLARSGGCFYCHGDFTKFPVTNWWGHNGVSIFLHPDCARELAGHLVKDADRTEQ